MRATYGARIETGNGGLGHYRSLNVRLLSDVAAAGNSLVRKQEASIESSAAIAVRIREVISESSESLQTVLFCCVHGGYELCTEHQFR